MTSLCMVLRTLAWDALWAWRLERRTGMSAKGLHVLEAPAHG